MYYGDVLASYK